MISYWREHRRRRWCLHLQNRALTLLPEEHLPVPSEQPIPQVKRVPTPSDFAVTGQQRVLMTAPGLQLSLAVGDLVTFLGSGPECRWRFIDAGLDRRHYVLFALDGALYGIDLSQARRRSETAVGEWWHPGTVVRAGALTMRPQSMLGRSSKALYRDALPLRLHWNAAGHGHSCALQSRITLIGGSPWSTIRLHDPGVAPLQAALVRRPHSLVLIDLADNTWTRRRGQPVAWSLLDPGDEFEVGRTAFQLSADWNQPAATNPEATRQTA